MLKIISVKGENFRSFKKFDFQIKDGLWVVKGNNKDDDASDSNGSGKSTLFCNSIVWCLTGTIPGGLESDDDIVNFKTKKDCLVEVVLTDNNQNIKITRTRKHTQFKNNLFLEIDGQSLSAHRIKDTQDRVDQIIKVSPELLTSTIIMTDDMSNCFSYLTPKDRITLLESVRDYKIWSDFRDESKTSLESYKKDIESLNNENLIKEGNLNSINNFLIKLSDDYKAELNTNCSEEDLINLKAELSDLESSKTNEEEINDLNIQINKENEKATVLQKEHDESVQSLNNLHKQNNQIQSKINNYKTDIERYSKLLTTDSICPTCGQKVVMSEEKKLSIIKSLNETKDLFIESTREGNSLEEKIKQSSLVEPVGLKEIRDNILNLNFKIKDLQNADSLLTNKINSLKNNIKILSDNISLHKERLDSIIKNINSFKEQFQNLQIEMQKNKEQIDQFSVERDAYQFFYDSLGPKGTLRPYLLRKDISYLNRALQYYAARLYSGTSIKLTVPTIESNKIDIIVENSNNMIKPVSSLSRGERKRLDLCIQFAIYDLVKSTAMFDTNILILDEIFDGLDVIGINHVISMLEERANTIPSIYVISHNPNVYDLIPRQILVSKSNDISKVVFKDVKESVEDVVEDKLIES